MTLSRYGEGIAIRHDLAPYEGNAWMREIATLGRHPADQPPVRRRPSDADARRPDDDPRAPRREPARAEGRDDLGVRAVVRAAALGAAGRGDALPAVRDGRRARPPARLRPDARGDGEGAGGGEGSRLDASRTPTRWRRRSRARTSSTRSRGAGSTRSPTRTKALAESGAHADWICDERKLALASPDVLYMHCLPGRPRPRGHRRRDRRPALGRLGRGREPHAHRQGAHGPHDGRLRERERSTCMARKRAVVAIGGNSLIKDSEHQTVRDQYIAAGETCWHIASMIKDGWDVAIGHGNGPQVGFILRRSELAAHELHEVPLDVCGADSQGAIGYALAQNLENDFRAARASTGTPSRSSRRWRSPPTTRPSRNPSKPIGSFMDEPTALRRRDEDGWAVVEDAGRGWRRVVASPVPLRIVEEDAIRALVDDRLRRHLGRRWRDPGRRRRRREPRGRRGGDRQGPRLLAARDGDRRRAVPHHDGRRAGRAPLRHAGAGVGRPADARRGEGAPRRGTSTSPRGAWRRRSGRSIGFLERGGATAIVTDPGNVERALAGETGTTIVRG